MKFLKIYNNFIKVNENDTYKDLDENGIYEILKRDCLPFLKEIKEGGCSTDNLLFRFSKRAELAYPIGKLDVRKNRSPLDTPKDIHEMIDYVFKEKFGECPRKDSLFTTKNEEYDNGNLLGVVFPIGNYNYYYHKKVNDLYDFLASNRKVSEFLIKKGFDKVLPYINIFGYISSESESLLDEFIDNLEIDVESLEYNLEYDDIGYDEKLKEKVDIAEEFFKNEYKDFLRLLVDEYETSGALESGKLGKTFFSEVMIMCDQYYSVHNDVNIVKIIELIKNDTDI